MDESFKSEIEILLDRGRRGRLLCEEREREMVKQQTGKSKQASQAKQERVVHPSHPFPSQSHPLIPITISRDSSQEEEEEEELEGVNPIQFTSVRLNTPPVLIILIRAFLLASLPISLPFFLT